jgi:hypothetical protein
MMAFIGPGGAASATPKTMPAATVTTIDAIGGADGRIGKKPIGSEPLAGACAADGAPRAAGQTD